MPDRSGPDHPTADQLAEKVRYTTAGSIVALTYEGSAALSELVARLAAAETAREQAEKERDGWRALATTGQYAEQMRADRDRLAAALERIAALDRQIDTAKQIAREALAPHTTQESA